MPVNLKRTAQSLSALTLMAACMVLGGCAPEVGSERWCEAMAEKPKGDWTANEALDYAEHCLID
jgi:hypothetical protein